MSEALNPEEVAAKIASQMARIESLEKAHKIAPSEVLRLEAHNTAAERLSEPSGLSKAPSGMGWFFKQLKAGLHPRCYRRRYREGRPEGAR